MMEVVARTADRVVFSALYNESDEFLTVFVENFLLHTTDTALLVINLPAGRDIACKEAAESDRVLVFHGTVARQKFGHTLLAGHLESFEHATQALGDFGFFCPIASNSLFARRFDLPAVLRKLEQKAPAAANDLDDLPDVWWWTNVRKTPAFTGYLKREWGLSRIYGSQIEGLFAARHDWGLLQARVSQIHELGATIDPDATFPLEEILPATIFNTLGSGHYTFVCHIFWDRSYQGKVVLADLVEMASIFPDHICILKWFERNPSDMASAAVSTDWLRDLLARVSLDLRTAPAERRFLHRMMLEELARAMGDREEFSPLSALWWSHTAQPEERRYAFRRDIAIERGPIVLPFEADPASGQRTLYIHTEDTRHDIRLALDVVETESTEISLIASRVMAEGQDADHPAVLEGYLYLRCLREPANRVFRLRCTSPPAQRDQVMANIVIQHGWNYWRVDPCYVTGGESKDFYFRHDLAKDEDGLWFGIPFFSQSAVTLTIDII